jgi:carbamoyltransferase
MERTFTFRENVRNRVPAVCHADHTGRLQSVSAASNEHFYRLIEAFCRITGVPILLNTSLNVMGKPIVGSFEDVLITFLTTDIDAVIVGRTVISNTARNHELGSEKCLVL